MSFNAFSLFFRGDEGGEGEKGRGFNRLRSLRLLRIREGKRVVFVCLFVCLFVVLFSLSSQMFLSTREKFVWKLD